MGFVPWSGSLLLCDDMGISSFGFLFDTIFASK